MNFQRAFAAACLIAAAALPCFAQSTQTCNSATPAVCNLYAPSNAQDIKPQAVPTGSPVAVTSVDAYLQTVTITNTTSGALTFTLADRQVSPIAVMSAVSIAANTTYVITFPLYWCPSGFTVLASGSGLNYWASWRQ